MIFPADAGGAKVQSTMCDQAALVAENRGCHDPLLVMQSLALALHQISQSRE